MAHLLVITRRNFLSGLALGGGLAGLAVHATDQYALRTGAESTAAAREGDNGAGAGTTPLRLGARTVVWNAPPRGSAAALTFDDGPTPAYTPRILDVLDRHGVRATFFVMGYNAAAHPSLLREVVSAGHELGTHSWSHLDEALLPPAQIRAEIVRGKDAVEQVVQQPVVGFRPPRGELAGHALEVCGELGLDVVLYSCTRGPGGTSTVPVVAAAIGSTVGPGDILDLHDGLGRGTFAPNAPFARDLAARREVEVRALTGALTRLADRGITLTTVGDLLGLAGRRSPSGTAMTSAAGSGHA